MVDFNSINIDGIHISQIIKSPERVCGIPKSTRNAKAHSLRKCSVKDDLRGLKGTKNGELTP